jgi:hypothetical protein
MVLYDKDFAEQGAIKHWSTKNESFLRVCYSLKKMGIKNYQFCLALYDRTLLNVDPFNITGPDAEEIQLRVIHECKINPWYAIREVVRIPESGGESIPFILTRASLSILWCFFNNTDTLTTIPRQCGKTITACTIMALYMYIQCVSCEMGIFAREDKLVQENISRIKRIRDCLPPYFINNQTSDVDNKKGMSYEALHNKIKTFVAANNPITAADHAKGETFILLWLDETAFFKYIDLTYQSAMSTTSTAQPQARANGIRCANMFTTTAGDPSTDSGKFANNLRINSLVFKDSLYDSQDEVHFHQTVKSLSRNNLVYIEFTAKQTGKSDEWLETWRQKLCDKPDTFRRDFLNHWIVSSAHMVLPQDIANQLRDNVIDPIWVDWRESMQMRWYVSKEALSDPKFKTKPLIIGMDFSDGVGRDFTTLAILDPEDMSLVGCWRCNQSTATYVAKNIVGLLLQFPRAILIPERNKNGQAIIDMVIDGLIDNKINPFRRIFNMVVQEYRSSQNKLDINRVDPRHYHGEFGFLTNTSTRDLLFKQVLFESVTRNVNRIYDAILVDELCSLTRRNGRIDHKADGHDDTVIAYLLASYLLLYGLDLHMYGLEKGEYLNKVTFTGDDIDPLVKLQQLELITEKQNIERMLKGQVSDYLRRGLEMKIKEIQSRLLPNIFDSDNVAASQVMAPAVKKSLPPTVNSLNSLREMATRARIGLF